MICGDCGGFYGHKVWHNHNNTKRYDVWYCNQKYTNAVKCQTPVLKETSIKQTFETVLERIKHPETTYSEDLWRELIDYVEISSNSHFVFNLKNGDKIEIAI